MIFDKYRLLLLIVFLLGSNIQAQSSYKLSVQELFDRAIENSVAIKESELKVEISKSKKVLSQNKLLPDIQFTGQFGFVGTPTVLDKDLSFVKHSETPDWKQNYQISAIQPLYTGGRIQANIKKSEIESEIAYLTLEKDKSALKLWLIGKYLDLYNLYQQEKIFHFNIEEANKRLSNIRQMREEGLVTRNDVLRSEIQLSNYELSTKEASNNIILVSQQLSVIMAMDEDIIYEPDSSFLEFSEQSMGLEDYIQTSYDNFSEMKIGQQNINLAKNNLTIIQSDFMPNLSLQIGNTFQRPIPYITPAQDLFINSWGVTLNLSYRISSLFDRKHSLFVAKSQINLQELLIEQQKQNIRTSVKNAYIRHQEARDRVAVLENSLYLANENYRISYTKYFNQLSILTDLLDANTIQLNASLQLTAAKVNVIYTYYQLLNISGKL